MLCNNELHKKKPTTWFDVIRYAYELFFFKSIKLGPIPEKLKSGDKSTKQNIFQLQRQSKMTKQRYITDNKFVFSFCLHAKEDEISFYDCLGEPLGCWNVSLFEVCTINMKTSLFFLLLLCYICSFSYISRTNQHVHLSLDSWLNFKTSPAKCYMIYWTYFLYFVSMYSLKFTLLIDLCRLIANHDRRALKLGQVPVLLDDFFLMKGQFSFFIFSIFLSICIFFYLYLFVVLSISIKLT